MPLVSVIIVNYNGHHLLQECLDSLREQTFRDFETILVDNGSSDGSVGFVRAGYPEVLIVETGENLGYGGGNNAGIARATGRYMVFLNNDTKADRAWLQHLVRPAEHDPSVGMCASRIMNYYETEVIDNTGLLLYRDGIARGRGRLERDGGQFDAEGEVLFPSGCAGLYRKAMLDEIGPFDADLFLYLDDVDIGLRGRLAGWSCRYVPGAVVYHKYSATTEPYSPLKAYLVERNRIWVVLKYFPPMMVVMSVGYTVLRYAWQAYGIVRGRGAGSRLVRTGSFWQGVWVLLKAYGAAAAGIPRILSKRRAARRHRRISNNAFRDLVARYSITAREVALRE